MREPDYSNWSKYNVDVIPDEMRTLLLRTEDGIYHIPRYRTLLILNKKNGYSMAELGNTHWSHFKKTATHWVYLDELRRANG